MILVLWRTTGPGSEVNALSYEFMTQQEIKNKLLCVSFVFLFSVAFTLPSGVNAASLFLESTAKEISVGQRFDVVVRLDADAGKINALEGTVGISSNLKILKIIDGNSLVNLWIKRPAISQGGEAVFLGIIPGGYQGDFGPAWTGAKPGEVFSLIISAESEGAGEIYFKSARAFLNDGLGTEAPLNLKKLDLSVGNFNKFKKDDLILDLTPPEHFTPEIFSDKNVFDDKWALVFVSQDKGSGIDRYEVLETRPGSIINLFEKPTWQIAESPYLLKDQFLKSEISVKAVDRAGNETIEKIAPRRHISWYETYQFWGIIILVALIFLFFIIKKEAWQLFQAK